MKRILLPLLLAPVVCAAQAYTPPPPPLQADPCVVGPNSNIPADPKAKPPVCPPPAPPAPAPAKNDAPTGDKPAAEQFPFPGEAPAVNTAKPAGEQFPYPGDSGPQAQKPAENPPAAPTPAAKGDADSAADRFPYPGETKSSPETSPNDSNSSSSSSSSGDSSSSSSSSGDDAASDAPDTGDVKGSGRHKLPKVPAKTPDERVTEDLQVAKFYSDRGNFQAAYMRSKDATTVLPDDAESHFRLAQYAQKLEKKEEAASEYTLYLKLDPGGDWSKQAEKALTELR